MFEFSSPPVQNITDMKQHGESLLALFTNLVELPFYNVYQFENNWSALVARGVNDDSFHVKIMTPEGDMAVQHLSLSPELVVHIMEIAAWGK